VSASLRRLEEKTGIEQEKRGTAVERRSSTPRYSSPVDCPTPEDTGYQ
jgi:hypothetical protein